MFDNSVLQKIENEAEIELTTKMINVSSQSTTSFVQLSSQTPKATESNFKNLQSNIQPTYSSKNPLPIFYQPAPLPVEKRPVGPYIIQKQTYTSTGELIIENLIGGVAFDCTYKPTGHWRDEKYCDIFHACVFGQQRKSYACPFVGERTYFDEVSRRCEFARLNPYACSSKTFYY